MATSCIAHLAGRTKVLAWFHLPSFFPGGYERTPIRQTTPYTRNVSGKPFQKILTYFTRNYLIFT